MAKFKAIQVLGWNEFGQINYLTRSTFNRLDASPNLHFNKIIFLNFESV